MKHRSGPSIKHTTKIPQQVVASCLSPHLPTKTHLTSYERGDPRDGGSKPELSVCFEFVLAEQPNGHATFWLHTYAVYVITVLNPFLISLTITGILTRYYDVITATYNGKFHAHSKNQSLLIVVARKIDVECF